MALDLKVLDALIVPLRQTTPSTLFGKGKIEEIGDIAEALGVKVIVVDDALTPVQQRNLEKAWEVKVVDRTGLILEIFARRARTREGKLQVELARLGCAGAMTRAGSMDDERGFFSRPAVYGWTTQSSPSSSPGS